MKPHKHAEIIKAWADGAVIECRANDYDCWSKVPEPSWVVHYQYRIKPEPKPDVSFYARLVRDECSTSRCYIAMPDPQLHNLKLTFDGETGELKAAKVLK